jgi:hypothetical protein
MGDYYQSPEPGWKSDVDALRKDLAHLIKEVELSTRIAIWAFSISWIAIAAMYLAGFLYYLPAKTDPLAQKLGEITGTLKDIQKDLSDLKEKVGEIKGKQDAAPVVDERHAGHHDNKVSDVAIGAASGESDKTCKLVKGLYDLGAVNVGDREELTITVHNLSGSAPVLSEANVGGPNASDFSLKENSCAGAIGTGASCVFVISFSPQYAGRREARLNFVCDSTHPIVAKLTGVGKNGERPR